MSDTIFNFLNNNYKRKPLTIDIFWFNDKNTLTPDDSLYQASASFNEAEAIQNNFKSLQPRDETITPSYSDNTNNPILRIIVKNRDDKVGDTIIIYEINFSIV